jgi:hypothetical protein
VHTEWLLTGPSLATLVDMNGRCWPKADTAVAIALVGLCRADHSQPSMRTVAAINRWGLPNHRLETPVRGFWHWLPAFGRAAQAKHKPLSDLLQEEHDRV